MSVLSVNNNRDLTIENSIINQYYSGDHFYMSYKRLINSSHWIDPDNGDHVKLSHNLKAVYHHMLDQYKAFTKLGKPYKESHKRISDILGLNIKTVEEVAIPLLKRMGLLSIDQIGYNNYIKTVYPLKSIKGTLINKKIDKHIKRKEYKKDKNFTFERLKNLEHNKKQIEKLKGKSDEKIYTFSESELKELLNKKG